MENTSAAAAGMHTFSHCHKRTGTETYPICVDLALRTSPRSTWLQLLLRYKVNAPKLPIKTSLLGLRIVPRETENNGYTKRRKRGGGGGGGGGGG